MTQKSLDDRRQALEDSFFKKENERVLAEFRASLERNEQEARLATVSGVSDRKILDRLFDEGFRAETWIAISLVPLVEVAWADGELSDGEREAILEAAEQDGITSNEHARSLLEKWLAKKPLPSLREDWKAYIQAVSPRLDDAERDQLKSEILDRSKTVARAASGILGLARWISQQEDEVLKDLMSAFEDGR